MDPRDEKAEQARRDLARLDQQSEKLLGAGDPRSSEDDAHDPAVIWGKRIGRGLGMLALAWLVWHLVSTYLIRT